MFYLNKHLCSNYLFSFSKLIFLDEILVYTVATSATDGFLRYLHSAEELGIKPEVLGFGEDWQGGDDIKNHAGGGWKINLLRKALKQHKNEENKIVLFTDG